jgi:hypothetical protein
MKNSQQAQPESDLTNELAPPAKRASNLMLRLLPKVYRSLKINKKFQGISDLL